MYGKPMCFCKNIGHNMNSVFIPLGVIATDPAVLCFSGLRDCTAQIHSFREKLILLDGVKRTNWICGIRDNYWNWPRRWFTDRNLEVSYWPLPVCFIGGSQLIEQRAVHLHQRLQDVVDQSDDCPARQQRYSGIGNTAKKHDIHVLRTVDVKV